MFKAIIIEDEPRARRILDAMIKEHCPEIEVVEMAEDVPSGVLAIKKHQPELVFLDVEMPGMDGFRLFEFFEDPGFEVVFTTAYNDFALKAFEVSAIDYLLKPIQPDQLVKAVSRAIKILEPGKNRFSKERTEALRSNISNQSALQKIALPVADGFVFVAPDDIIFLMADGSYTKIFLTGNRELLVTRYLKDFVELINHPSFFKPHRSYYINLNHISQYVKQDGGHIIMTNGETIHIARDIKEEFLNIISNKK